MSYPQKGECRNTGRTRFKKGMKAWNKNNHRCCNTGRTHFKVGEPGYWTGKKRPPMSEEWRKKIGDARRGNFYKGEKASYFAKHLRIYRLFGKPIKCELCDNPLNKRVMWSNKKHTYSRKREDWQQLCDSCHLKYDYAHNGRRNQYMIKLDQD